MASDDRSQQSAQNLLSAWLETANRFYNSMAALQQRPSQDSDDPAKENTRRPDTKMAWEASLKSFQTLATAMENPETMERLTSGLQAVPEVMLRMVESGWNTFFKLQTQWLEKTSQMQQSGQAYNFENLDRKALRIWSDLYEKEFRQFLNVPQVGLTRFYQERMGQSLDRFFRFQTVMAEFIQVLHLPIEKSIQVLHAEINELAEKNELPGTSREYYQRWIKILEGHYMRLYQSDHFADVMARTLAALEEFMAARDEVILDALQSLPIPDQKEMDELYKEVYLLKRRVRKLEKQLTETK
jgi:class III poly(R)-hydroxyalkanoic acid synthase PhaE subunit